MCSIKTNMILNEIPDASIKRASNGHLVPEQSVVGNNEFCPVLIGLLECFQGCVYCHCYFCNIPVCFYLQSVK